MIWESTNFKYSRYLIYFLFGIAALYFNSTVDRSDFTSLIICYSGLFVLYGSLIYFYSNFEISTRELIAAAVIIRLMLAFTIPNLSDDYFRFIWDGTLPQLQINPFAFTPDELAGKMGNSATAKFLDTSVYPYINSTSYYSIYPPVCQWIFQCAGILSGYNIQLHVTLLKLFLIAFETGSILIIIQLLHHYQVPKYKAALYAFNPLVIMELCGNLHMEAAMIFFLLTAIYLLVTNRFYLAAIFWGLAVAVKLWPLMFLPVLFKKFSISRVLGFSVVVLITAIVVFAPHFYPGFLNNYFESFNLYFQKFEFNASFYYVFKWITGHHENSNHIIQQLMPILTITLIFFIVILKNINANYPALFLIIFSGYLFFGTTIHPWYITPLIAFSIFTTFRFPVLWSILICFTYVTYATIPYKENFTIVAIEYILICVLLLFEMYKKRIAVK